MKANRRLYIMLFLIFSLLVVSAAPVLANPGNETGTIVEEIDLTPEPESEVILEGIKAAIWDDGRITVSYSGSGQAHERFAYHFEVDPEAGTYLTHRLAPPTVTRQPNAGLAMLGTFFYRRVDVVTEDVPNIDVAESENYLIWESNFYSISSALNYLSVCEGKTTPISHWYADTCYKQPVSYSTSQAFSWTFADFYNWDFMDPNQDTWTDHYIEIYGYPDGDFDYYWSVVSQESIPRYCMATCTFTKILW